MEFYIFLLPKLTDIFIIFFKVFLNNIRRRLSSFAAPGTESRTCRTAFFKEVDIINSGKSYFFSSRNNAIT